MTEEQVDTLRPWQRSSIGDRRSVLGAIALVLVAALYVVGVPFLDENIEASLETDEAGRFAVDEYTTILLPDGWSVESQSELFTTLTDGTYQLILVVSNPADVATAEEALRAIYDVYGEDPGNELTPLTSFTTDSGGDAAGYRAVLVSDSTGNGAAFYAVIENGRSFQPSFTGPADLADPYYDDVDAIVRSVQITAEPRDGGS